MHLCEHHTFIHLLFYSYTFFFLKLHYNFCLISTAILTCMNTTKTCQIPALGPLTTSSATTIQRNDRGKGAVFH